jgi:formylglycine-generating enzyme required for sulfatase activity
MHELITPARLIVATTVTLAITVAPVALAATDDTPHVTGSAVSAAKFKKLKQQVAALQQKVDALQLQPGSQGPQGEQGEQGPQGQPGVAPACQGNDANDVMVSAGSVCIDRYEASVWSSPTGGTQYGVSSDDYPCNDNGQNCTNIYARSVPGVTPSRFITYFQAQQALANVGKRLATNAEWQQAVAGTPDSEPPCNVSGGILQNTGANAGCVSRFGANDMVGNLHERVADWVPASTACAGWGSFSGDDMCLSGASTTAQGPGALIRGGSVFTATGGPFEVDALNQPQVSVASFGFRGAR